MPTAIYGKRQLSLRIVYAGPGVGGKTTNLRRIDQLFFPGRPQLVEIATAGERTVGGDFLPVGMEEMDGWKPRLQLATVPGQIQYGGTREKQLRGADVVVFVADSLVKRRAANLYALDDLRRIVDAQGRDPSTLPIVFQYNKRDLHPEVMPLEEMDRELNPAGAPALAAQALHGIGVVETLREAVSLARQVGERFLEERKQTVS